MLQNGEAKLKIKANIIAYTVFCKISPPHILYNNKTRKGNVINTLSLSLINYELSNFFTISLTFLPSARPFTLGLTIAITLPISLDPSAPVSCIAS